MRKVFPSYFSLRIESTRCRDMKIKHLSKALFLSLSLIGSVHSKSNIDVEYITEPCLIPVKGNRFKLCDNMIVRVNDEYHVVPNGFKTDLATIPRIMWPIFAPSDYDTIAPSVMHDWDYCCVANLDRKKADEIFYYGLIYQGASPVKAYIYYVAVRSVGWLYYTNGLGIAKHAGQFDKSELQGIYKDVNYGMV